VTQHQIRPDKATAPNIISTQFVVDTEKRVEAMIDVQAEIFAALARLNRDWFDRAKSEARFASELSARLTAAHSMLRPPIGSGTASGCK
jgi:hypothetical protein